LEMQRPIRRAPPNVGEDYAVLGASAGASRGEQKQSSREYLSWRLGTGVINPNPGDVIKLKKQVKDWISKVEEMQRCAECWNFVISLVHFVVLALAGFLILLNGTDNTSKESAGYLVVGAAFLKFMTSTFRLQERLVTLRGVVQLLGELDWETPLLSGEKPSANKFNFILRNLSKHISVSLPKVQFCSWCMCCATKIATTTEMDNLYSAYPISDLPSVESSSLEIPYDP